MAPALTSFNRTGNDEIWRQPRELQCLGLDKGFLVRGMRVIYFPIDLCVDQTAHRHGVKRAYARGCQVD